MISVNNQATCIACGSPMQKFRKVQDLYSEEFFELFECLDCHLVSLTGIPLNLEDFYQNKSGSTMRSKPSRFTRWARNHLFALEFNKSLAKFDKTDKIIDLGCGDGSLVEFLTCSFPNVYAVDMYPKTDWNGTVPYEQLLSPTSLPSTEFFEGAHAVIMRHVFEHVPRPDEYLAKLKKLGVKEVLVVVPNRNSVFARLFGGYWYYWDPPRHLTHFSTKSLHNIGLLNGYSTYSSRQHGIDEVIVSLHTYLMLNKHETLATIFKPTGIISSVMSILSYPFSKGVIVHHFSARDN